MGHKSCIKCRLSSSQVHITDYKLHSLVYVGVCGCRRGDINWTCIVWAERFMPGSFGGAKPPTHSGEQKGITQTIILTSSRPVGCPYH